ncbi:MAG: hypothetical protein VX899_04825 [Myxococcota bacterium]|nr:hypothetical protein [Myxococcota bacterium]
MLFLSLMTALSANAGTTLTTGVVSDPTELGSFVPQSFPDCGAEEVWFDGACRDFTWLSSTFAWSGYEVTLAGSRSSSHDFLILDYLDVAAGSSTTRVLVPGAGVVTGWSTFKGYPMAMQVDSSISYDSVTEEAYSESFVYGPVAEVVDGALSASFGVVEYRRATFGAGSYVLCVDGECVSVAYQEEDKPPAECDDLLNEATIDLYNGCLGWGIIGGGVSGFIGGGVVGAYVAGGLTVATVGANAPAIPAEVIYGAASGAAAGISAGVWFCDKWRDTLKAELTSEICIVPGDDVSAGGGSSDPGSGGDDDEVPCKVCSKWGTVTEEKWSETGSWSGGVLTIEGTWTTESSSGCVEYTLSTGVDENGDGFCD